jgi:hypothetical protein
MRALEAQDFKWAGVMAEQNGEEPIYGDLEVDDFNTMYSNSNLIQEKFGETIKVQLKIEESTGECERTVAEDLALIKQVDK